MRSDKLFKHVLTPVCEECGYEIIRVDQLNVSDSINQTIIDYLKSSELVIADITEHNPNAFYEVGFRTALGKPIIHVKDKNDTIPFDVASVRTFDYDLQDLDAVSELKKRLVQTINAFNIESTYHSHPEKTKNELSNQAISQVLQGIFSIQDSLKDIKRDLNRNNESAISVLADKLANNRSVEETALQTFISELFKNPQSIESIMKLGQSLK